MSKRPLQNNHSNYNSKKSKHDFDNFKAPSTSKLNTNVEPKITLPPKSASTSALKIPLQQQSIADKNYWDDDSDDDDVCRLASQNVEEQELLKKQKISTDTNLTYTGFMSNAQKVSSTQHKPNVELKTGYTEKIQNELFVDLTTQNQHGDEFSQSSQKENISTTQMTLSKQQMQIKELQAKNNELTAKMKEMSEKLLAKDGETKNLRLSKKSVEDQLKKVRLEKLEAANTSRHDPEKEALRREIEKLRVQKEFSMINDFPRHVRKNAQRPPSKTEFYTNLLPATFLSAPQASPAMFEIEEILSYQNQKKVDREMSFDVICAQLKLAQCHAHITAGSVLTDAMVDNLFDDAAVMILRVHDYIEYLEKEEKPFTIDHNLALTSAVMLSTPEIRLKLTRVDSIKEGLSKENGRISIFQAKKLFPEEICAKPRRIIAFYASLAAKSLKFSEKMLIENIAEDSSHQTIVTVLTDSLKSFVSQSDDFSDYCGFVIAAGSLLSSLGSHYSEYESLDYIDTVLTELLVEILRCRCDNPLLMVHVVRFLADVSSYPEKTGIIRKLCVKFPMSKIVEISRTYKHFEYPRKACILQLVFSYLLTTFKHNINSYEMELLLETLLNLNRLTSNIQELPSDVVKFMNVDSPKNACGCLQQLTNTTVSLNYLMLVHRNKVFFQQPSTKQDFTMSVPRSIETMEFQENHAFIKELVKRGVTMTRDLFFILEQITYYPLDNLVFSNRLEQFWNFIKREKCYDINGNPVCSRSAYRLNSFEIEALHSISLRPNLMTTEDESGDDNIADQSDESEEQNLVALCHSRILDIDKKYF